jgi:hypothetical protein
VQKMPFCWAKPACFDLFSSNYKFSGSRTKHRCSCSYWCKAHKAHKASTQSFKTETKEQSKEHIYMSMKRSAQWCAPKVCITFRFHHCLLSIEPPHRHMIQNQIKHGTQMVVFLCWTLLHRNGAWCQTRRVSLNPFLYLFLKISRKESFHRFFIVLPIWRAFFQSQFLSIKCSDL